MTELAPAILTNDVSDFRQKHSELLAFRDYFKILHIDFADGEFVPNKTIKPHDLFFLSAGGHELARAQPEHHALGSAFGGKSPLTLMAHFMTFSPQRYFWDAKKAGFKTVLVHYEAFMNDVEAEHTIEHGKSMGLKVGLVLNPETSLHKVAKFIKKVDLVQLMGIHPGFQGREFLPETYKKVKELRALNKNAIIAVDGGVKVGIARKLAFAGANIIVAGSAIVRADDEEATFEALKKDIES